MDAVFFVQYGKVMQIKEIGKILIGENAWVEFLIRQYGFLTANKPNNFQLNNC